LLELRQRGLSGVEFVVSDDHAGLKQAIVEVLPEAAWQRCYVHFLRNALDYVPRKVKRRTHVVRIFPNAESCLRLVRALAVEMHENWLEAHRYLNMDDLREHKKEALRMAA
jgi:transposase-like protein